MKNGAKRARLNCSNLSRYSSALSFSPATRTGRRDVRLELKDTTLRNEFSTDDSVMPSERRGVDRPEVKTMSYERARK